MPEYASFSFFDHSNSFIGSSMAFIIAFILPCWSFVAIESEVSDHKRKRTWVTVAWLILVFSVVGAVTCTTNSLLSA